VDEGTRLLLQARDGNRLALAEFVRRSQPEIWRLCVHLVGRDDADDATQETFVAAWRSVSTFRAESSARTWLFVIARRTCERIGRRHIRWRSLADGAARPIAGPSPERATELELMLASLDSDRRLALVLTQIIGLSYDEAAEVCECAVGTIRSRVARARGDLLRLDREWQAEPG
jgi:RNA polymerase sigma-70 factor (ECF subfamily)